MNKKEQKQVLLNILYTSERISRFIGDELSYSNVAVYFLKIDGKYSEIKSEYRNQFNGFSEEYLETKLSDKKRDKVIELIGALESELRSKVPKPTTEDEEMTINFSLNGSKERQEILLKFHSQCQRSIGEKVSLKIIPNELVPKLENILLRLGKAVLQLEILLEAREKIILNDIYQAINEFETVPEACRSYVNEKNKEFDIENGSDIMSLKEWFIECVLIIEDGESLNDRKTINARINAWVNHERNKYNN